MPDSIPTPTPPTSHHPHEPLPGASAKIIYTETDEAPALATFNLLPIFSKFARFANIDVVPCDISLAGRVLAAFPEKLKPHQRVPDNLEYLGELCKTSDKTVSIIKLPNISASVPQLHSCITELRVKGYDVPLYTQEPSDDLEREIKARYAKVLGSAVNPVIRQGNSDRHASPVVKADAQKYPSRLMKLWSKASRTHVAHMTQGDFYASEMSKAIENATDVSIELIKSTGETLVLKESTLLQPGEIIDASFLDVEELCKYYELEMQDAKDTNILFSLHLKATMMKVSDPIMFGHGLKTFFKSAYDKYGKELEEIGANPNDGLASILSVVEKKLSREKAGQIREAFEKCHEDRPWIAMVDSDKGITNWHVPSDIIIDNSMPIVIRDSGCMWNKLGKLEDTKCLIPDRCYATVYQEAISYVKTNEQFDCATMGHVSNVGLMAMKAEEYGSHDKTFEAPSDGIIRVRDKNTDEVYFKHTVKKGDIWRMCQTKDEAVKDWVKLAVDRARETGAKTIFWLDPERAHDSVIMKKVGQYLPEYDTADLDICIMKPTHAIRESMERATKGLNTISVTGNVLRDYLTDLFPILELGTSAKVMSLVSLLAGGMLYEAGAGGSAPKHVAQFVKCDHLRWNSLGEYQAMAEAFSRLGKRAGNSNAESLGQCLYKAIGVVLEKHEMPERRVHDMDNRDTNFFIALHWAEFLAKEDSRFEPIFERLSAASNTVITEVNKSQGSQVDLGGYYQFDYEKAKNAMNPSHTLLSILENGK
jgi:isocitrate dehydrogenase